MAVSRERKTTQEAAPEPYDQVVERLEKLVAELEGGKLSLARRGRSSTRPSAGWRSCSGPTTAPWRPARSARGTTAHERAKAQGHHRRRRPRHPGDAHPRAGARGVRGLPGGE